MYFTIYEVFCQLIEINTLILLFKKNRCNSQFRHYVNCACFICWYYTVCGVRFALLVLMILHIFEVLGDKLISLFYAVYGAERVGRGIECIVHKLFNCC